MTLLWWFGVALPLGVVAYTYAGYPVLVFLAGRLFPKPLKPAGPDDAPLPRVAIVVACYNGTPYLAAKLDSLREQDYPDDLIDIIVVDDGSADESVEFLKSQSDVTLIEVPERAGKPHALNRAREHVKSSDAQIAILTDVRQPLSRNTAADLVSALADPTVGIAGGELVQVEPDGAQAPIGLYWRYEKAIRISESTLFSTVGVSGALYAIAVADWPELPDDTILDDVEIPIVTLRRGLRSVLIPGAIALDQAEQDISGEWRRKVRTLTGNYQTLARNPWLLSPRANPAWGQFISHKVLRLVVPWALLVIFLSSLLLPGPWAAALLGAQVLAYLTALVAIVKPAWVKRIKPASLAGTFVALNTAAVVALFRFLTRRYQVTWQQGQQTETPSKTP